MPAGYGADQADVLLTWEDVESRLIESLHYWVATTRPDGRPHVVPRWGVWLRGRLWYDGSPDTVHARNLGSNPLCVVHLESGSQVVIVEGASTASEPLTGLLAERVAAEFARKYAPDYTPSPDSWSGEDTGGMRVVTPRSVLAWFDFPHDLTRFSF
jgi:hypothetical protein